MRTYLQTIQLFQKTLLVISILMLIILPITLAFSPKSLSNVFISDLYLISHLTVFFVMIIRPLADIFIKVKAVRSLVILRKGFGVISASIIVSFIFSKIIIDPTGYLGSFITAKYWSMQNLALFAHLADISGIILLVTSNNFSKRVLANKWKMIQKLAYVYFYASSIYVYFISGKIEFIVSIFLVTILVILASTIKRRRLISKPNENVNKKNLS